MERVEQPRAPGRLAALDGLRLVAALGVAVFHYAGRTPSVQEIWGTTPEVAFPVLRHAAHYGWLGVELFFLISGFVICMSAWDRRVGAFARSRFLRLFPAYWPAVLITAAVLMIRPVGERPEPSAALVNLTMLNVPLGVPSIDGVYWTLWSELRFYLLFAIVVWIGLTRQRVLFFGYAWLIAGAIATNAREPLPLLFLQPMFAPLFVAGIGFSLIHRFGSDLRSWGLVAASYALALHNVIGRVATAQFNDVQRPMSPVAAQLAVTGFFLVMAAVALGWTNLLRWSWLTTAGLLTYPFYLLHEQLGWTIILALHDRLPRPVVFVGTLVAMLLAAWLLHRLVERPTARWLRRRLDPPISASTFALKPEPSLGPEPRVVPQWRFRLLSDPRPPNGVRDSDGAETREKEPGSTV